jgi:large subunit ribosomal protein L10
LAITKEHKNEMVEKYVKWIERSEAFIVTEYRGITMPQIDALRSKIREAGGEFHIVKNTLGELALEKAGLTVDENMFTGSTAVSFAFDDAPAVAKATTEFARTNDFIKIKGGYLGRSTMTPDQVKALADLPPLPVMRATLLGVLSAPASKLVRTLAEPGRSIAAVIKAHSEQQPAAAA